MALRRDIIRAINSSLTSVAGRGWCWLCVERGLRTQHDDMRRSSENRWAILVLATSSFLPRCFFQLFPPPPFWPTHHKTQDCLHTPPPPELNNREPLPPHPIQSWRHFLLDYLGIRGLCAFHVNWQKALECRCDSLRLRQWSLCHLRSFASHRRILKVPRIAHPLRSIKR